MRAGFEALGESGAFDEFHDESVCMAGILEAVNRGDAGMIERGEKLRFALEASHAFSVVREGIGQDFQRDVAAELGIACAVDFAHPASAKGRENFIRGPNACRTQSP